MSGRILHIPACSPVAVVCSATGRLYRKRQIGRARCRWQRSIEIGQGQAVRRDLSPLPSLSPTSAIVSRAFTAFGRVEQVKYLRTTLTCPNWMHEEIKSRLKLGNAGYHSVHNLQSSCMLSKNLKIKIYRTEILPVVLYGCATWSLTLRSEHRLRVFENRVLRGIFGV